MSQQDCYPPLCFGTVLELIIIGESHLNYDGVKKVFDTYKEAHEQQKKVFLLYETDPIRYALDVAGKKYYKKQQPPQYDAGFDATLSGEVKTFYRQFQGFLGSLGTFMTLFFY